MKSRIVCATIGGFMLATSGASAMPHGIDAVAPLTTALSPLQIVQFSSDRGFRRCMRDKYGPRYFAGVRRATRYFMAQACGG